MDLIEACKNGHLSVVNRLLKIPRVNLSSENNLCTARCNE